MPMRILPMLTLVLLAAGCTTLGDPPARFSTLCDSEGLRAEVGRPTSLDQRPRPECRPTATQAR
jgi:hypothetical protein